MSKSKAISRPFEQTAQQRAELDALHRMLDLSEGTFSLSVAVCNSPALRDHIIGYITSQTKGIEVVRVPEDTRDVFDLVRQQIPNGSPRAIFIVDLEKALGENKKNRVLQGLNVSREQWQTTFKCPVVFWLPEYVQSLLMTQARDLWSWISHNFEFVSEQATAVAGMEDSDAGNTALSGNLDLHEKRFRMAELEQRIADAGEHPEGQLKQHILVWRNELAYLQRMLGNLDGAMALLRDNEYISRELNNQDGLQLTLRSQALISRARGDIREAMTLQKEVEQICRQLENWDGLQVSLGDQGLILKTQGRLDEAMDLFKEQERLCREINNLDGLQISLGNQGLVLEARGDLDEAMILQREKERLCRQLGSQRSLHVSLGNQASIMQARGDLRGAMTLFKDKERICRQLGNMEGLVRSLANQAVVLQEMGHVHRALQLAKEAHRLASKHGYTVLARWIEPMLDRARRAAEETSGEK